MTHSENQLLNSQKGHMINCPDKLLVTVSVLWLFFVVSWVGLQCVIVVFP